MSTDDSMQLAAHNGTEISLTDPTHTFVLKVSGKATLVGDILRIEANAAQTGRILAILDTEGSESLVIGADGTLTMTANNIATDTTTGMKLGTSATQKVGLWGVTPIVQRSGAAQAAVAGTAATNSSPYGFAQAQADAIVTLINEMRATLVAAGIMKGAA